MQKATVSKGLTLLSTVWKSLILDENLLKAWYHALYDVTDQAGEYAFKEILKRSDIFGDPKPGHVIEIAEKRRAISDGGKPQKPSGYEHHRWISEAPPGGGNGSERFLVKNPNGDTYLMEHPEHWPVRENDDGTRTKIRPKAEFIGNFPWPKNAKGYNHQ